MLGLPDQRLSGVFSTLGSYFVSFQSVLFRPQTQIRIFLILNLQITIPNLELFPNRILIKLPRIAFPTIVLPKDDRTDYAQKGTTGSSILDHNFGLTWAQADTASAACPEHPGGLDMPSITFAAVICDAEDPCSVNTAYDPESSFTMSPWSTIRPRIFEVTDVHQ